MSKGSSGEKKGFTLSLQSAGAMGLKGKGDQPLARHSLSLSAHWVAACSVAILSLVPSTDDSVAPIKQVELTQRK